MREEGKSHLGTVRGSLFFTMALFLFFSIEGEQQARGKY